MISAVDKNKNKSEKTYTVHVEEETIEQPVNNSSNSGNTNTGGSGYNPPVNNSGDNSTSNNLVTCIPNGTWSSLGNSGYANYNYDAALQWGEENCPEGHRVVVSNVRDNCGNEGWSVQFVKRK